MTMLHTWASRSRSLLAKAVLASHYNILVAAILLYCTTTGLYLFHLHNPKCFPSNESWNWNSCRRSKADFKLANTKFQSQDSQSGWLIYGGYPPSKLRVFNFVSSLSFYKENRANCNFGWRISAVRILGFNSELEFPPGKMKMGIN